jgi:two-component system, NtrC family, sensor histidine kinase KinB
MTLRRKLMFGFGGLLLILLVVSGLSIGVLTQYSSALDQVFRENYDSAVYCDRMKEAIDTLNGRAQRIIWQETAGDQAEAAAMRTQFDENLKKQTHNITLGTDEKRLTEQIQQSWLAYGLTYDRFESAAGNPQKLAIFRDDLLKDYDQVKTAAQATEDLNIANMVSVDERVKRMLGSVRDTLALFALAGTLLAVVLLAAMGATVLRPLQALTKSAKQIGEGDLDLQLDVKARDEIGQLSDAFNLMASRLREFRRIDLERLQRTQETTQLAIDSLRDAVFVIGPAGVVEISNLSARSHFAVSPGTALASLHLAWLDKIYAEVCATREPCDPQGYASAIQLFEDGHERFLLPRAVPMTNAEGQLMGVTVILVDVTRLRHADELKSGLVSTVSHELRTPLTAIRMAVLMLVSGKLGTISPLQQKALEAARDDSDRLYRTIDNLLSMSRIDSGGQQFHFRPMTVEEIVRQAVDPLREQIAAKKLMLSLEIAAGLPSVMADVSCVGYVLANLLSNAIKFTPPRGSITLGSRLDGDHVQFEVSDSGPGIPPEFRSHLFERFYRVPRAEGPSGAGLGLSIAREIVEAHGGRIDYAERAGGGSVFRFTLRSEA